MVINIERNLSQNYKTQVKMKILMDIKGVTKGNKLKNKQIRTDLEVKLPLETKRKNERGKNMY